MPPQAKGRLRRCAVCDEDESEQIQADDVAVECIDCGLCVHPHCYGTRYITTGTATAGASGRAGTASAVASQSSSRRIFRCALCAAGIARDATPPCLLCGDAAFYGDGEGNTNRAMKRTSQRRDACNGVDDISKGLSSGTKKRAGKAAAASEQVDGWVHLACVFGVPGPFLCNAETTHLDDVGGIAWVEPSRWSSLRCAICDARGALAPRGERTRRPAAKGSHAGLASLLRVLPAATVNGAAVQCWTRGCGISFHVLCARAAGWVSNAVEEPVAGSGSGAGAGESEVRVHFYCGAHSSDDRLAAVARYDAPCGGCHSHGGEDTALLCDDCDATWHMGCLNPPLKALPAGDWFCPKCTRRRVVLGTVIAVAPPSKRARRAGNVVGDGALATEGARGGGSRRGPRLLYEPAAGSGGRSSRRGTRGSGASATPGAVRSQPLAAAAVGGAGGGGGGFVVVSDGLLDSLPLPSGLVMSDDEDDDDDDVGDGDASDDEGSRDGGTLQHSRGGRSRGLAPRGDAGSGDAASDAMGSDAAGGDGDSVDGSSDAGSRVNEDGSGSDASDGASRPAEALLLSQRRHRIGPTAAAVAPQRGKRGRRAANANRGTSPSTSLSATAASSAWAAGGALDFAAVCAAVESAPPKHALETAALARAHMRVSLPMWTAAMRAGCSIALYGFGDKTDIAEALAAHAAPDAALTVLRGGHPGLTLRAALRAIADATLGIRADGAVFGSVADGDEGDGGGAGGGSGGVRDGRPRRSRHAIARYGAFVADDGTVAASLARGDETSAAAVAAAAAARSAMAGAVTAAARAKARRGGRAAAGISSGGAGGGGSSSGAGKDGVDDWDDDIDLEVAPGDATTGGGGNTAAYGVGGAEDDEDEADADMLLRASRELGAFDGDALDEGVAELVDDVCDNFAVDESTVTARGYDRVSGSGLKEAAANSVALSTVASLRHARLTSRVTSAFLALGGASAVTAAAAAASHASGNRRPKSSASIASSGQAGAGLHERANLPASTIRHVIVLHGGDGPVFREPGALRAVVAAATSGAHTRLIATFDHVASGLLLDESLMLKGNVVSRRCVGTAHTQRRHHPPQQTRLHALLRNTTLADLGGRHDLSPARGGLDDGVRGGGRPATRSRARRGRGRWRRRRRRDDDERRARVGVEVAHARAPQDTRHGSRAQRMRGRRVRRRRRQRQRRRLRP